jgi:UDP-GlcNAc:undecaprenyl-phosphate GlcNAc-1-phosphate transferase
MMTTFGAPFLLAMALSLLLVPLCRRASLRLGFIARPRHDRWHRRPVALFGGVAIAAVVFGCATIFGLPQHIPVLMVTAALMFGTGLVDDRLFLKPSTKLIAQIALASALLAFGYRLHWLSSITLDSLLTLFWVVGLTNAFNLIDNMDGLCAGIALIVGTALLIELLPVVSGTRMVAEVRYLAILLGAISGFLIYNVHPASIFMGDSGSLLIGFSLAALTLSTGHRTPGTSEILTIVAGPVLVLLVPIFDTTLVTLSRWMSGRRASEGGADHSSHRLVAIGLSERRAVALLWLLGAVGGILGTGLHYSSPQWSVLVVASALIATILFAAYLAGIRVYEDTDTRVTQGTLTPIIVEFMYKRRVAEVLLDFCLVTICYYAAYRMRFEDPGDFQRNFDMFSRSLPVVVAAQMVSFFVAGVYRGVWRHFGMMDTLTVGRGVFYGVASSLIAILFAYRFFAYSRTIFVIYGVLLLMAVTLSRASFRLVAEFMQRQRRTGDRVVIYGAGDAAGVVVGELLARGGDVRILGFIDDDPRKAGNRVAGYPVLGSHSALTVLVKAEAVDSVVISTRQLPPERLNNLQVLCDSAKISLSRLTIALETIVEGERDVDAESSRRALRQIRS